MRPSRIIIISKSDAVVWRECADRYENPVMTLHMKKRINTVLFFWLNGSPHTKWLDQEYDKGVNYWKRYWSVYRLYRTLKMLEWDTSDSLFQNDFNRDLHIIVKIS